MPSEYDNEPPWSAALDGLARRVLGPAATSVRFARLPGAPAGGLDEPSGPDLPGTRSSGPFDTGPADRRYEYRAQAGRLTVAATDTVSAAVGLHHYLRERCGLTVTWDTSLPLPVRSLPDSLPSSGAARVRHGYYLNFCTFSYTMPYWTWADWEREIDWMALHGITMPLAATGHEAAVLAAYTRLGLDEDAVRDFLGGPGYLPFQFMGCLDGFAGPLPRSWLDGHRELGARILQRERELGMTPVLPAFTGHVPRQLAPDASSRRDWQGFETWVLDPAHPMYQRVCTEIARAQIELFGSDHLYAADPFIEMVPVDADPAFPGAVATATLGGLRAADPDAVWLMQAWPFSYQRHFWTDERVAAFLDAIPDDRILLADLWAEHDPLWQHHDQFCGKPWLWCSVINFGGRTDPATDMRSIPGSIDAALDADRPPAGIGLAMEATRNNTALYELVVDQAWNRVTDVGAWLDAFAAQRYGLGSAGNTEASEPDEPREPLAQLRAAWRGLLGSIYDPDEARISPGQFQSVVVTTPSYLPIHDDGLGRLRAHVEDTRWYRPDVLVDAWDRMIGVAERDPRLAAGPLGHDLVDVGAAYLGRLADRFHLDAVEESVRMGRGSRAHISHFLQVFDDLERLLASRREFTFQHWEEAALSWASDPGDREILLDNARRIITAWGPTSSPLLDDYAGRLWSGLVGGYYRDRWQLWADGLDTVLTSPGGNHDDELRRRLQERADAFLRDGPGAPPADVGDVVAEARRLHTAYARFARASTNPGR